MAVLAIIGLLTAAAGVALCFHNHLFSGLALLLFGMFLVDLYKEHAVAAAIAKTRKELGESPDESRQPAESERHAHPAGDPENSGEGA